MLSKGQLQNLVKRLEQKLFGAKVSLADSPRGLLSIVTTDERWEDDGSLSPPYETSVLAHLQVPYDDPVVPGILAAFWAAGATQITEPEKLGHALGQWKMEHPQNSADQHLIVLATPFPRCRSLLRFSDSTKKSDVAIIKVACDKDLSLLRGNTALEMRQAFTSASVAAREGTLTLSSDVAQPVLQMLSRCDVA